MNPQENNSKTWLKNKLSNTNMDYIPYFNKPMPYGNNETYPINHPSWNTPGINNDTLPFRLSGLVLIDWDGYKPDTVSYDELAKELGFERDKLMDHCIQWDEGSTSLHFLFKLPKNAPDIKQANNGNWLKGVDIKTGNQLCYLKAEKYQRLNIPFAEVPTVVLNEALAKTETNTSISEHITPIDKELTTALGLIDPNCGYDEWMTVIAGTVSKYGRSTDVVNVLDGWSSTSDKYKGKHEIENKVHSFEREGGITWNSVIHLAGGREVVRRNTPVAWPPLQELTQLNQPFTDVKETRQGTKVLSTSDNLRTLLNNMQMTVGINEMNLNMDVQHNGIMHQWSYDKLRSVLISESERQGLPKIAIDEHLSAIAEDSRYHPVKALLDAKQWDGIPRVSKIIEALPTTNTDVRNLVMRKWFISAIAAIYEPGFSTKLVPVLKGDQSAMKSAFIKRICSILPDSFLGEATLNPDDVDNVIRVCKHHIVELAELERTTKREAGALKAFITTPIDNFRVKYGRSDTKKPRQTVFIATVNDDEFFKDTTGNTRFSVIELTGKINIDLVNDTLGYSWNNGRITQDSSVSFLQFWLEVKHYYDNGESWTLSANEQDKTEAVNKKFIQKGNYYNLILESIDSIFPDAEGRSSSVVTNVLNIPAGQSRVVGRDLNQLVKDGYLNYRRTSTVRLYSKK